MAATRTEDSLRDERRGEVRRIRTLASIRESGVIPVLRVPTRDQAICGIRGILKAGLGIAEITLTIPGAIKLIEELRAEFADRLLIGAGTVLDSERCKQAIDAGSDFIVSPVFDADVLETAHKYGALCVPGALTPAEIFGAWRAGADLVKVFPANSVGGPAYIRALKGPFPQIELIVTGGVDRENAADFLAAGATAVGAGQDFLPREALIKGDVEAIAASVSGFLEVFETRRLGGKALRS